MTLSPTPPHVPEPHTSPAAQPRLNWAAVTGFGAVGLLWPLMSILGLDAAIGGIWTLMIVIVTTGAVWIVGAGFGRVPRPVLTLTLSGILFGLILAGYGLLRGDWPDYGPLLAVAAVLSETARAAGLGALAGLAARAVQRSIRA